MANGNEIKEPKLPSLLEEDVPTPRITSSIFDTKMYSPKQQEELTTAGYTFNDAGKMISQSDTSNSDYNFGDSGSIWGSLGLGNLTDFQKIGAGLATVNTVYSLYDNIFGNSAKNAKLERKSLKTQIATNEHVLAEDKKYKANIAKYFG